MERNWKWLEATKAALPEFSRRVYDAIQASMYAEPNFSDVTTKDIAKKLGVSTAQIKGALAHLHVAGLTNTEYFDDGDREEEFIHTYEHDESIRVPGPEQKMRNLSKEDAAIVKAIREDYESGKSIDQIIDILLDEFGDEFNEEAKSIVLQSLFLRWLQIGAASYSPTIAVGGLREAIRGAGFAGADAELLRCAAYVFRLGRAGKLGEIDGFSAGVAAPPRVETREAPAPRPPVVSAAPRECPPIGRGRPPRVETIIQKVTAERGSLDDAIFYVHCRYPGYDVAEITRYYNGLNGGTEPMPAPVAKPQPKAAVKLYYMGDFTKELAEKTPRERANYGEWNLKSPVAAWYADVNFDAPPQQVMIERLRPAESTYAKPDYADLVGGRHVISGDLYPTRPHHVKVRDEYGEVSRWVAGPREGVIAAHGAILPDPFVKQERESAREPARGSDNKVVAETILHQLGGQGRLKSMIGAKDFLIESEQLGGVSFKFMKGTDGINFAKIILAPSDTYEVHFGRSVKGLRFKWVGMLNDIYADALVGVFEQHTGLKLSLGTMGRETAPKSETTLRAAKPTQVEADRPTIKKANVREQPPVGIYYKNELIRDVYFWTKEEAQEFMREVEAIIGNDWTKLKEYSWLQNAIRRAVWEIESVKIARGIHCGLTLDAVKSVLAPIHYRKHYGRGRPTAYPEAGWWAYSTQRAEREPWRGWSVYFGESQKEAQQKTAEPEPEPEPESEPEPEPEISKKSDAANALSKLDYDDEVRVAFYSSENDDFEVVYAKGTVRDPDSAGNVEIEVPLPGMDHAAALEVPPETLDMYEGKPEFRIDIDTQVIPERRREELESEMRDFLYGEGWPIRRDLKELDWKRIEKRFKLGKTDIDGDVDEGVTIADYLAYQGMIKSYGDPPEPRNEFVAAWSVFRDTALERITRQVAAQSAVSYDLARFVITEIGEELCEFEVESFDYDADIESFVGYLNGAGRPKIISQLRQHYDLSYDAASRLVADAWAEMRPALDFSADGGRYEGTAEFDWNAPPRASSAFAAAGLALPAWAKQLATADSPQTSHILRGLTSRADLELALRVETENKDRSGFVKTIEAKLSKLG